MLKAVLEMVGERRLPYRVQSRLDRWLPRLGFPERTVRARGLIIRARRNTSDMNFIHNVLVDEEYTSDPRYQPVPGETVVDIGGNIGTFSLLCARVYGVRQVVSYEPAKSNYRLLRHNLARNHLSSVVATVNAAVSDRAGQMALYTHERCDGGFFSLEERREGAQEVDTVQVVAAADLFATHGIERCHLLKLDCEGAEYPILYGVTAEWLKRVDRIVMEFHGPPDEQARREQSDRLVAHLRAHGFLIDHYEAFPAPWRGGHLRARQSS